MSKKNKKATDDPTAPMAEDLGQSADEETAEKYTASLSAEQQLVNSTAPDVESRPSYISESQSLVDAIADRVVEQLKPFIAQAFDEAIARAFADKQES